ncbi:GDP-6-deoxy-D-mannose reductase [Flavobacterium sp. ACN2]|jgi:nucleoside-diphosphate-sugar epimerase|uniref:NAD-dependent epimerase/dehydratase family protein n=1 Tax=unclassified Flavobacterium TaxID=196869 RepID=UPI000BB3A9F6|nr:MULTISPECIES: NAD-dependent epimerase/dehydratase family protein [unclassified Flavobacterium]MDY0987401.1 NAD-dependent epimerase/dehydratase family protein [Flavobacterium sp. CFBP9031]PBI84148.1 GDP-6-deoxy-D-mannose reductase [Flavobacterium sp. ACN2]
MLRVIITGKSGFVAQNLSSYFSTIPFSTSFISLRNSKWKNNLSGDVIIHLAGKAHDLKNVRNASEYFEVNTYLTHKLFDFFIESEIKDFIYFSSVKAVADQVSETLYEDVLAKPKTPYGQSKLKAEEYILSKQIPEGKRVFIIRPCMIHGPGNKGNLNLLYNFVKKRIPYPLAAFHNERSFLGIDNLNFLIKEIIQNKQISSGVYNFSDDEVLSTNELIEIVSRVLNKKTLSIAIPKALIKGIGKIGDVIKLPLNSDKIQKLTENYRVSNQKIKDAVGIDKMPYTAKEGLERTIKSFIN